jgi:hypothetical protein
MQWPLCEKALGEMASGEMAIHHDNTWQILSMGYDNTWQMLPRAMTILGKCR